MMEATLASEGTYRRGPEIADSARSLESARRALRIELAGLKALDTALAGDLGRAFDAAIRLIRTATGRIIVTGIGKSGHIGRKIAATLASTGTPALFIHATEASHGDLGMIDSDDIILALSWSGETSELGDITSYSRRFAVPLVAVTSNSESTLARAADVRLTLPRADEACPHGLAPTTSSMLQLAIGDALAIALLESRGFTASEFGQFHPGGKLGSRLLRVDALLHSGGEVPLVVTGTIMSDVLIAIAGKRFGCVGVLDPEERLVGIVTDGDLRRHMGPDLLETPVEQVMTVEPLTLPPEALASSALELMNRERITAIFIVTDGKPIGILHVHDLLRAGVA
jgi:arabinose-5-phosphate isomerase